MKRVALILFFILFHFISMAQIGTNPGNAYGSSQPGVTANQPVFKGDSGAAKNVYHARSVKFITEKNLLADSLTLNSLDTTLHDFEHYSKLYQPSAYYINLGNYGLAATPLLPRFNQPLGFNNGQTALSLYILQPSDINYYRNKSPYTELSYITGKGQKPGFSEGLFHIVHTRNIHPRLNIGIEYNRSGSNGYYARQTADILNFDAFLWYQARNLRYNLITNFITNTVDADENGGVKNNTLFTLTSPFTHPFEPVYLSSAHTVWKDAGFYARQYYLIGKIDSLRDPVSHQVKVYPTARAYYTFQYKHNSYNFNDNRSVVSQAANTVAGSTPLYYPNIFLDTLGTADRTSQSAITNEFGLSLFGRGNLKADKHFSTSGIRLDASIKDEYIHYRQNSFIDSTINNISVHANAGYELSNRFNLRVIGDYVLAGPNHFDTYLALIGSLSFGSLGTLNVKASYQNNAPALVFNRWYTNSYRWNFHFANVKTKTLSAFFENTTLNLKLGVEYNLIDGYLYFAGIANQVVFPNQYSGQIKFFKAMLDKDFRFGKAGFQAHLVYQHNSAPFIIRTPDFYSTATLYYQNLYFKVLNVKVGLDATYYTHAYEYDYAPGLQQFFVYTNQKNGDYPIADVFLLAGLRRTSFILRYDYFNQHLPQAGYYTVHNYPMPDHLFKFGLSWKFYD